MMLNGHAGSIVDGCGRGALRREPRVERDAARVCVERDRRRADFSGDRFEQTFDLGIDEQQPRARIADHADEARRARRRCKRRDRRPRAQAAEKRNRVVHRRARAQRNRIARLDAVTLQRGGKPIDARIQRRVTDDFAAADQRRVLAALLAEAAQHVGDADERFVQ